jgi:hypothetical protein
MRSAWTRVAQRLRSMSAVQAVARLFSPLGRISASHQKIVAAIEVGNKPGREYVPAPGSASPMIRVQARTPILLTSDGTSPDHPNRDSRIGSGCRIHHFPKSRPCIAGRNRSHNSFHLHHHRTGHTTAQRTPHHRPAIRRRRGRVPRPL